MKKNQKTMLIILLIIIWGIVLTIEVGLHVCHIMGINIPIDNQAIYKDPIISISIKYYEGYNIATGNALNGTIPLNEVKLGANDYVEVSTLIKELKKVNVSKESEEYQHMIYHHMSDYYEIDINSDFIIYIGDEYGFAVKTGECFPVSDEFFNKVKDIVKENNEKNLYKNFDSKKATLITKFGKLELNSKELNELSNVKYYTINKGYDYDKESLAYTLELDNDRVVYVYDVATAYIRNGDGTNEYIYSLPLSSWVIDVLRNHGINIEDFYSLKD